MTHTPSFPPLLIGLQAGKDIDPFDKAISMASRGCDGGTIVHGITTELLRAAFVFAPEVPLSKAASMMVACGVGFSNALGALAPPEIAVHLTWDGQILVNGAVCGHLQLTASERDPSAMPDWLVIGLTVALFPAQGDEGGLHPDQTTLFQEGCAEVDPVQLLESWARHTLVWVNRWSDEGVAPLHAEWRSMLDGVGENTTITDGSTEVSGLFLGIDEDFGMLIRTHETTKTKPLTDLI